MSHLNERYLNFLEKFLEEYTNIKFHENISSDSQVVPYGRTDRQTDMKKLIVAFFGILRTRLKVFRQKL